MPFVEALKYVIRSRSWRFMRDRRRSRQGLGMLRWQGIPLFYRPGTIDTELIYRILLKPAGKREYEFPCPVQPKVILDLGANIGVASRLFASRYPEAEIHCFEPVPDNLELLRRNVGPLPKIHVHGVALGRKDEMRTMFYSDDPSNFGGFSFHNKGSDPEKRLSVPVKEVNSFLGGLGIERADIIKIDTEGSEHEILTALDRLFLDSVTWILGELHDQQDFKVLAMLDESFEISIDKPVGRRLSRFYAIRRATERRAGGS